ncbi:hypothetical protein BB560_003026 [Smittium megazygosporum]|uniref:Ribosomal RNA-processing protein 8 n=1 Tax=Smittium megazygosporum TaxID=133381 RepID=A0A2T9ZD53_9FUNG|nr:hypothetical protein BB560_003026 [Smittium megazygosporum]
MKNTNSGIENKSASKNDKFSKLSRIRKMLENKSEKESLKSDPILNKRKENPIFNSQKIEDSRKKKKNNAETSKSNSSAMQQKMSAKLDGAKFRWINEKLYTSKGSVSFDLVKSNPLIFDQYHKGFTVQAKSWPINPVDVIIKILRAEKEKKIVVDLGCGDAKIAKKLSGQHDIHSYDLVSDNKYVTACNISNLPLDSSTVDISIFCLSLMGTDWVEFIIEACRVLKIE